MGALGQSGLRLFRALVVGCCLPFLSACADIAYMGQSATGHLGLVWRARPLPELIEDASQPERLRSQLSAARDIRRFAVEQLGLPDNRSYTRYVDTGQPYVVWNVMATDELSLKLKGFCFPVLGCISYKGFYSEADAHALAAQLREQGLEVAVGGVPAYSTLGWTPDPLLNTFVFYPRAELARLMFHELAHQQIYIADDTAFNESFATAVEEVGVELWLRVNGDEEQARLYREFDGRRKGFQQLLLQTRQGLKTLYDSDASDEAKRAGKQRLFAQLRQRYEALRDGQWKGYTGYDRFFQQDVNNARLAGMGLYSQWVPAFKSIYEQCQARFDCFYERVRLLGRMDRSAREQSLSAYENPKLASPVLLPDFIVR